MKNNSHSVIKHIIDVTLSNVSTIIAGIIVGFFLPKLLSVADYGWYKTFTLYMTYVGFFSLGLIDGIVLKYGGYDYSELDRTLFRSLFKWYFLIHIIFACFVSIISIFINDLNYRIILLFLSVNMIAVNITGYFQQISQITQRFKEYSLRKIIQSILNIIIVFIYFCIYRAFEINSYIYYLVLFVLANVGLTIWYTYTYRDIVFGKSASLLSTKSDVLNLCKIGFPLLFANLCSTLILTIDRQFVSILFDTAIYAQYAFAYNMLALVTVATSAMSTVLYPTLKRTTKKVIRNDYPFLVSMILIIVFGALTVYFPLCLFVEWFLPKYEESLIIFRIVFPGLALSSPITVIMHNVYKTEGNNFLFFKKSLVVLLLTIIANGVAYTAFQSTQAISISSIIIMVFWYFFAESYFYKEYSYSGKKNSSYIIIMMVSFYLLSSISNYYVGFVIYFAFFLFITIVFFRTTSQKMKNLFNNSNYTHD